MKLPKLTHGWSVILHAIVMVACMFLLQYGYTTKPATVWSMLALIVGGYFIGMAFARASLYLEVRDQRDRTMRMVTDAINLMRLAEARRTGTMLHEPPEEP